MTDYLGLPVLERPSNAREDPSSDFSRSAAVFDPGPGKRNVRAKDAAPGVDTPFIWTCEGKAEIAEFKQWFSERKGKLVPFWVPTWRQDLFLAQPATALDTSILIHACGYTLHAFPQRARRHLAFHFANWSMAYRNVTNALAVGLTETISFSGALGNSLTDGFWVSYLAYCRLVSDDLELHYLNDSKAEAVLHFAEIPAEAP